MMIRTATPDDAEGLAPLLGELGYPSDPSSVALRMTRLRQDLRAVVLVAETAGNLVGVATAHVRDSLNHDEPAAQLTLLVVDSRVRGSGVGQALVSAGMDWARTQGARRLTVNTAVHREAAHRFYENRGFTLSGRRYAIALD
ncbi:GNAT family N-acetyltransferase [Tahibacter amnicola]|uniref:GNAT family N-acetyltransferase n=1 Tax=Tahibacter amnicola TaxID=2976241 RepID=A0ABY6BFS2_9GAMM|nr:GNAT family N-acetyltransferase [Tahibacter amnicola]UXI68113.1 GNAT family N-acetyltransferase [Tahibacter amnicola]